MNENISTITTTSADCRVISNVKIGERYRLLTLENDLIARTARPGQFVMLKVTAGDDPFLARPFAIFDTDPDKNRFSILYIVVGRGTRQLTEVVSGALHGLGPLGNGFSLFKNADTHIAVGGGSGLAALYPFVKYHSNTGSSDRVLFLSGARDTDGLLPADMLDGLDAVVSVSTDDGSAGFKGNVIELLEQTLAQLPQSATPALYVAGPAPMMAAAARLATDRRIDCAVSLENRMACGIGVCRGCVCKAKKPDPETGLINRSVCADGPVFDITEIDLGK